VRKFWVEVKRTVQLIRAILLPAKLCDVVPCHDELCAAMLLQALPHIAAPCCAVSCRCLCIYSGQLRGEVLQDARILAVQALIQTATPPPAVSAASTPVSASAQARPATVVVTTARASTVGAGAGGHIGAVCLQAPDVPHKLHVAAMSRLNSVLYGAPGAEFLAFTGTGAGCGMGQRRSSSSSSSSNAGSSSNGSSGGCGLGSVASLLLGCAAGQGSAGVPGGALVSEARQVRGM
jgi:hypothetical protein